MSSKDEELEKILNEIKNGKGESGNESPDNQKETSAPEPEKPQSNVAEEINSFSAAESSEKEEMPFAGWKDNYSDDYAENGGYVKNNGRKKIIIAIIAAVVLVAALCGVYFGFFYEKEEPTTTTESTTTTTTQAPVIIRNPLTGEPDYNENAVGKRPIAVVVENSSAARPQYSIGTADIIVEGEAEGGETRMLWLYADMTKLPEMTGPVRSARPSYVQFSELFDSLFVHYGGSHSKDTYVGGYETIENDDVDNIDGMTVSSCFKRTTDRKSPHNAVLLGDKLAEVIENKGYRTQMDENSFSTLKFNEDTAPVSSNACNTIDVKISASTRSHTLAYNADKKVYVNENDYKTEVDFTNVIVMFAESEYIQKQNYKGTGKTETYLNYDLTSGTGQLASCGTITDFEWSVTDGKLSFKDMNGTELKFNPGKSWICLASSNHSGKVTVE